VGGSKLASGDTPAPRIGHVLIALPDGKLLLHGGIGMTSAATADSFLLDTKQTPWTWSKTPLSTTSLPTPALAWHSAVLANDTVVVSYGLDMNDQTATTRPGEVYFFSDNGQGWTWASTYMPMAKAAAAPNKVSSPNPPTPSSVVGSDSSHSVSSSPQPSKRPPVAAGQPNASSEASPTKTIAGALGGIFGAAILAGLAGLYFRRRAAAKGDKAAQLGPMNAGVRLAAGCAPAPVSRLLFTRPVPRRILSLGSSASFQSTTQLVNHNPAVSASISRSSSFGSDMAAVGAGFARGNLSFDYPGGQPSAMMEQSGQHFLSRGHGYGVSAGPLQAGVHRAGSQSTTGTASVTSYPFLTSFPVKRSRTTCSDASNHATVGVPEVGGGCHAGRIQLDRSNTVRPPNGPRPFLDYAPIEPSMSRALEERPQQSSTLGSLATKAAATGLAPPFVTVAPLRVGPRGPRSRSEIPGFLTPAGEGGLRVVNAGSVASSSRPSSSEGI
jgi:Galactose oxidase, central domain